MRILVAEDNGDIRALVTTFLGRMGHCYEEAENGAAAIGLYELALAKGAPFNLLLLDASMPERTGYEVAQYVRKQDPDVPIVIMSGLADPLIQPHADHVRASGVLTKPFSSEELREVLEPLLGEE